jgi:hypothetical protein
LGFTCTICGRFHEDELLDVRAALPEEIFELSEDDRRRLATIDPSGDFASLLADRHFVRALIEIPLPVEERCFGWGVWVRLTRDDLAEVAERWTDPAAAGSAYAGWLATDLPAYGPTRELPGSIRLGAVDELPGFELSDPSHPLAVEQRSGISLERARELADPYRQA